MKIYDITQEVFNCEVYPGDPVPERKMISSIKDGDLYNLTAVSMCTHNGTHIDSPYHFIDNGKTIEEISVDNFVGECYVAECNGKITSYQIKRIIHDAGVSCSKKILIKGDAVITIGGAKELVEHGVQLIGVESQTVGPSQSPMEVHIELLKNNIVILEGIRLNEVRQGRYFLSAAPLLLGKCDGAPCRALLIDFNNTQKEEP